MNHVAHQTSMKTFEKSTLIKTLAVLASESDQISAAEGMIVYHEVKHGYSYISQACGTNLIKSLFESSSSVAKSLSCGKTKSRAIACNIFGPYFTKKVIDQVLEAQFYSLSYDASNKGNCKTYPFTVQFFSDVGVKRVLIQFIEDPHETAEDIFKNACRVINDFQLKIEHLTSVSANNTNVNFGEHHSVFRLFKNEAPHIVQGILKRLSYIEFIKFKKLQQRLRDKYFGNRTHDILRQLQEADANKAEEFKRSFESFIETVIEYIKSYYDDNTRKFYEKLSFFSYQSLEFLALERLMDVADLVKIAFAQSKATINFVRAGSVQASPDLFLSQDGTRLRVISDPLDQASMRVVHLQQITDEAEDKLTSGFDEISAVSSSEMKSISTKATTKSSEKKIVKDPWDNRYEKKIQIL
ncbi:unnamed protein product [Rotaria socialis]